MAGRISTKIVNVLVVILAPIMIYIYLKPQSMLHLNCQAPMLARDPFLEDTLDHNYVDVGVTPGLYGIQLFPGYTLKKHQKFTKIPMDNYRQWPARLQDRLVYYSRQVSDAQLTSIRSDPGVEAVWGKHSFVPQDIWDEEKLDAVTGL